MFSSMMNSQQVAHRFSKAATSLFTAPIKGYKGNCPFLRSLSTISDFNPASYAQPSEKSESGECDASASVKCAYSASEESISNAAETTTLNEYEETASNYYHLQQSGEKQQENSIQNTTGPSESICQSQQQGVANHDFSRKLHQLNPLIRRAQMFGQESLVPKAYVGQGVEANIRDQLKEERDLVDVEKFYDYDSRLRELIQKKKDDESYRVFRRVRRFSSNFPHGIEQGRPVTIWCSNDYFGMSSHPKVCEAIRKALDDYGAGSGGTRNIAGNSPVHEQLEWELADLHQKEAALLFSSCYVANDSTLFTLLKLFPNCEVFSDAGNHASMIQGIRNSGVKKHIFRAFDAEDLETKLKQVPIDKPKIVAFETVHSMTGDISDVERMCDISHKYGAITFVDEVHAVGLYGERGAGIAERDNCMDKIDIVSGTLGKAYGNCGGYVAASAQIIDVIRSYASGFIFTTSLPPTVACGATESVRILKGEEGRKLRAVQQNNVFHMKRALTAAGLPHYHSKSHIVPIPVGNAAKCTQVMNDLLDIGHYIQSINYPTVPKGTERLRVSVTPFHDELMIDSLIEKLVRVWGRNELNFLPPVEVPSQCRRHQLNRLNGLQDGQSLWCDLCHRGMNLCLGKSSLPI